MITSVYKQVHPQTGIIEILLNTECRWVTFQINRLSEEHKIVISFYPDCNPVFPPDSEEIIEYIDMKEDFNSFNYVIYYFQDKDQIMLLLVPKKLLLDRTQWNKYETD